MSPKHLSRYITEFAGRHNVRDFDTIIQMEMLAKGFIGKRLRYQDLIKQGWRMSNEKKKSRGRPIKNEVKTIPAPAERIAKAIFHAADKKIPKQRE